MVNNLERRANHSGQLFLLVSATIFCILGFTPMMMYSLLLIYVLPFLGIWQIIDFLVLSSASSHKKWHNLYIWAVLIFVFFALTGYIFSENIKIVNYFTSLGLVCYSIIIAWIYLLYWRKR